MYTTGSAASPMGNAHRPAWRRSAASGALAAGGTGGAKVLASTLPGNPIRRNRTGAADQPPRSRNHPDSLRGSNRSLERRIAVLSDLVEAVVLQRRVPV